jgi:phosphatidylserine decarboxylase
MQIHREGYSTLTFVSGFLIVLNAIARQLPRPLRVGLFGLSALVFGFFTQFFRNPDRTTPQTTNSVIAPADGTIVAIEHVPETEYFHDERLKISIYMSAFNVHLNRAPVTGKVLYTRYHPGQYLVAFHPKASELNERNTVVLEDLNENVVLLRQIAGLIARRIRCYVQADEPILAGSEVGFIKFGSRCDVFLPLDCQVCVRLQDKVKGGETLLAVFAPKK